MNHLDRLDIGAYHPNVWHKGAGIRLGVAVVEAGHIVHVPHIERSAIKPTSRTEHTPSEPKRERPHIRFAGYPATSLRVASETHELETFPVPLDDGSNVPVPQHGVREHQSTIRSKLGETTRKALSYCDAGIARRLSNVKKTIIESRRRHKQNRLQMEQQELSQQMSGRRSGYVELDGLHGLEPFEEFQHREQ